MRFRLLQRHSSALMPVISWPDRIAAHTVFAAARGQRLASGALWGKMQDDSRGEEIDAGAFWRLLWPAAQLRASGSLLCLEDKQQLWGNLTVADVQQSQQEPVADEDDTSPVWVIIREYLSQTCISAEMSCCCKEEMRLDSRTDGFLNMAACGFNKIPRAGQTKPLEAPRGSGLQLQLQGVTVRLISNTTLWSAVWVLTAAVGSPAFINGELRGGRGSWEDVAAGAHLIITSTKLNLIRKTKGDVAAGGKEIEEVKPFTFLWSVMTTKTWKAADFKLITIHHQRWANCL